MTQTSIGGLYFELQNCSGGHRKLPMMRGSQKLDFNIPHNRINLILYLSGQLFYIEELFLILEFPYLHAFTFSLKMKNVVWVGLIKC